MSTPQLARQSQEHSYMEHVVAVGMDVDTLKQLDNLRRAHPNVPSRVEVIRRLIWDAHAKVASGTQNLAG
jgi:hypothetical protein